MAEVDTVDELIQKEFDLSLSDCGFIGTEISFEIMLGVFKHKVQFLFER